MISYNLQYFGGRGASSSVGGGSGAAGGSSEKDFIERLANDLAREYTAKDRENGVVPYSNSDLQAEVEAYAMTHKGVDENAMLNKIRDRADTKQIERNIKSLNEKAFEVEKDGKKARYIFQSKDGKNYYMQSVGGIPKPTPNNMTPKEMMARAKSGGANVKAVKSKDLVNIHKEYKKDREATNKLLNDSNVRNKGGDATNKAYRNSLKAARMARRRK